MGPRTVLARLTGLVALVMSLFVVTVPLLESASPLANASKSVTLVSQTTLIATRMFAPRPVRMEELATHLEALFVRVLVLGRVTRVTLLTVELVDVDLEHV